MFPLITRSRASYIAKVLSTGPICYWPLNDASGTIAKNLGSLGAAADATYYGARLNQFLTPVGSLCPQFDGINDYVNIYSAALAAAFNNDYGSIAIWSYLTIPHEFGTSIRLAIDDNNAAAFFQLDNLNGDFYSAISTATSPYVTLDTGINVWNHPVVTWDAMADEAIFYNKGSLVGSHGSFTSMVGSLAQNITCIGSYSSGSMFWGGYLAHAAVWDKPLTPKQIALLG